MGNKGVTQKENIMFQVLRGLIKLISKSALTLKTWSSVSIKNNKIVYIYFPKVQISSKGSQFFTKLHYCTIILKFWRSLNRGSQLQDQHIELFRSKRRDEGTYWPIY